MARVEMIKSLIGHFTQELQHFVTEITAHPFIPFCFVAGGKFKIADTTWSNMFNHFTCSGVKMLPGSQRYAMKLFCRKLESLPKDGIK